MKPKDFHIIENDTLNRWDEITAAHDEVEQDTEPCPKCNDEGCVCTPQNKHFV